MKASKIAQENSSKKMLSINSYFPPLEDIEKEEDGRLAHQPIKYRFMFDFYKEIEASFWTDEDINKDCERDAADRERASESERRLFDYVQGFFAVSDFVVKDVIASKIGQRIKNPDVSIVYDYITAVENIHMITYSKVIEKAVPNSKERQKILESASRIPTIKKKIDWIRKWVGMENDVHGLDRDTIEAIFEIVQQNNRILEALHPGEDIDTYKSEKILNLEKKLSENIPSLDLLLISLSLMEGIMFSGSFGILFWFAKNNMFPGACKANQLIKNDEGTHVQNGALIHRGLIKNKVDQKIVHEMVREAVEIENDFMCDAMPPDSGIRGMNSKLMARYTQYSADWVLELFGYEKLYNIRFEDTFDFMIKQSITDTFTDFFREEEVNYKLHGVNETPEDKKVTFAETLEDI